MIIEDEEVKRRAGETRNENQTGTRIRRWKKPIRVREYGWNCAEQNWSSRHDIKS